MAREGTGEQKKFKLPESGCPQMPFCSGEASPFLLLAMAGILVFAPPKMCCLRWSLTRVKHSPVPSVQTLVISRQETVSCIVWSKTGILLLSGL